MELQTKTARIERGLAKLIVPHRDGELTFVYPAKGPDTYVNVGNAIEEAGLVFCGQWITSVQLWGFSLRWHFFRF